MIHSLRVEDLNVANSDRVVWSLGQGRRRDHDNDSNLAADTESNLFKCFSNYYTVIYGVMSFKRF